MPGFLPWLLFGHPPLLTQCVDLDVRLYYKAVQNLVNGCGNVPQTTTEAATLHRYTVPNMCSNSLISTVSEIDSWKLSTKMPGQTP